MATLTAGISATQLDFAVSGDVSSARTTEQYRIDDEVIVLREFIRTKAVRRGPRNRNMWGVSRGAAGTTAAPHLAGALIVGTEEAVTTGVALTPPEPFAGEGGDGSGLPSQWTATASGQVAATADDPDEAVVTIKAADGSEASGDLVFEVQGETGETLLSLDPYGSLTLHGASVDPSNGGSSLNIVGVNGTIFSFQAFNGAGDNVGSAQIGAPQTAIGFFGAAPSTRSELPATPTIQDVVDCLVTLGLVTQGDV